MAEANIDLKLYLSGNSAVEQGLKAVYDRLAEYHEQAEKIDAELKKSVGTFGEVMGQTAEMLESLGLEKVAGAFEGLSHGIEQVTASTKALNGIFSLMSGQSFVSVLGGLQQLTVHFGASGTASYVLGTALTSATSALQLCAGAAAAVGAAFIGWQIGTKINELELFGVKVKEVVTVNILHAMEAWEMLKHAVGGTSDDEFAAKMQALQASIDEVALQGGNKADPEQDAKAEAERKKQEQRAKFAQAKQEAEQRVQAAVAQRDVAILDNLYQSDVINFQQYLSAKRELLARQSRDQLAPLLARQEELKQSLQQLSYRRKNGDFSTADEKEKLEGEKVQLEAQIEVLKADYIQKSVQLDTTEAQQRKVREKQETEERKRKVEAEAEAADKKRQAERKLITEIAQDHQKLTETKLQRLERETAEMRQRILTEITDKKACLEALATLEVDYRKKLKELRDQEAAEKAKSDIEEVERKTRLDKEALEDEKKKFQADFRNTNAQKRAQELKSLEKELELNIALVEEMEKKAKLARDEGRKDAAKQYSNKADQFRGQARGVRNSLQEKKGQPDPHSLSDQMSKVMVKLQNEMKTLAENIAGMFEGIVNSAIDSTAQSISGLIKGTMTWGQALQNIGDSILNSIISSFAKMAAQWIVNQILMWTIGKALGAASVTATAPMASASAAMWAGPALMASVASYGGAVGAGQAALTAGLTANQASAKAFSVAAAEGGLIKGPGTGTSDSIPAMLSNGEFVIPARKVQQFGAGFFEGIRNGTLQSMGVGALSGGRGGVGNLTPNINVQSAQPKVVVVNSQEELMKVMKGSIGEEITVAHIAKNKLRLGMAS